MSKHLLIIDQGTTSTRAILFNELAVSISKHQIEFKQYFPASGWVEHDTQDIWSTTLQCCQQVIDKSNININDIAAIGITNQRETTVLWDRKTGEPIYHAIVWQDRRTTELCAKLKDDGNEAWIRQKTGLLLDPYFSATKISWILDHVPDARMRAERGELAFGTIDSYILWQLTGGKQHCTDITNASRTLLFNIYTQRWDEELLKFFNIPASLLPEVKDNCADFGICEAALFGKSIPITAMAGDQQAALVGQACFESGMIKSTYGTGAFLMMNTGEHTFSSANQLLTTIAYRLESKITYALEGSIFAAGSIVQWLRDKLQLIKNSAESEIIAKSVESNFGVYLVPAFTGLGAPYWQPDVRGVITGLTRNTDRSHIIRAGLEAVAYQTRDLIGVMLADSKMKLTRLRVDGGMVVNDWLLQFMADIIQLPIERSAITETTALGVAFLAGLGAGIYSSLNEISALWKMNNLFIPKMAAWQSEQLYRGWCKAISQLIKG